MRWRKTSGSGPEVWTVVLDPTSRLARQHLLRTLDRLKKTAPPSPPQARGIDETGPNPPPTFLLRRGDYTAKGPEVPAAFPVVLAGRRPTRCEPETPRTDPAAGVGTGRLAHPARPPAHRPGDRQPPLAASLRPGDRRHAERLRHDGGRAVPPRIARLARDRAGRPGLEPQGDASPDRHQRHLSPVVAPRPEPRSTPTPRTRCSGGTPASGSTARPSATPCSPSRAA